MRQIKAEEITAAVQRLYMEANFYLGEDVRRAIKRALVKETSPLAREILNQILENAKIASKKQIPICQDTGFATVFLEIGQGVQIVEGELKGAIDEGIRRASIKGYLRSSIVSGPFCRRNTGDNTPAVLHTEIIAGENIRITVMPKGAGSENTSRLTMLSPSDGERGVKEFIIKSVEKAAANPCPPIIVGVGIGGTFEMASYLAKKALLRPIGSRKPDTERLEREILESVNELGIGPQGFGGRTTALAVHLEKYPCHIASLPVAVNLNCHAARNKQTLI